RSRVSESMAREQELLSALNRLSIAALIVDANCKVLHMNGAVEAEVRRKTALSVDASGLRAASSNDTATLRRLIGMAAQPAARRDTHAGGSISIRPSSSAGAPFDLVVTPVSVADTWPFAERGVAAVYVTRGSSAPVTNQAGLRSLYDLTTRE